MLCRAVKSIIAILLISLIAMPVSLVFGTTIAVIITVLVILYVFEKNQ